MRRDRYDQSLRHHPILYQSIMDQKTVQSSISIFERMYEYKPECY